VVAHAYAVLSVGVMHGLTVLEEELRVMAPDLGAIQV
jgi:hypothetical protein